MGSRRVALKIVVSGMGMVIAGSALLSGIGPLNLIVDRILAAQPAVAATAFGAGLAMAGFDPEEHPNWIRVSLLYSGLTVIWGVFVAGLYFGAWAWLPMIVAVVYAILVIALYPDRRSLWPARPATRPARPTA